MYKEALKKIKKEGLKIFGLDLLFFIILYGISFAFATYLSKNITLINSNSVQNLNPLMIQILIFSVLYILTIVILWSIIKGYTWSILLDKKLDKKFYVKFSLVNLILGILIFVFFELFGRLIQFSQTEIKLLTLTNLILQNILFNIFTIIIIVPIFLSIIAMIGLFYISFITEKKYFKEFFKRKFYKVYIPSLILTFIAIGLSFISSIFNLINTNVYFIISTLTLIAFFTYFKFIILELKKNV